MAKINNLHVPKTEQAKKGFVTFCQELFSSIRNSVAVLPWCK